MVRPRELGPVPDRLVAFTRRELAWHLDRLPPQSLADRQTLSLALAERCPQRLPARQLASARGPLRQRKEEAVAHVARPPARGATKAPSAVEQTMIGRSTAADSAFSAPCRMRARMLPPNPAPMMRAP